ncbi:MAG: aldehyde dehydrogenase family protein [Thaumarchaeota archaeon]|nr:aldehyde dehydrogenase family protein [Candidatus Calditenuaceae archaeon]MDW8043100.1 aldehyde dehydrogenase family protein [Nitrososphaerota archaeon]
MEPVLRINLFIEGQEVEPSSGSYIPRTDPGDESRTIGLVADGSRDVGAAVDAARRAFDNNAGGWVSDYRLRARVLFKAAELIREDLERLARLESLFSGKTIRTSRTSDIPRAAEIMEFYAGLADKVLGTGQIHRTGDLVAVVKQPVGVVAAITPWNFPFLILCRQVAPALAAGCTVVAKPSSLTSASAVELAKILSMAGAPKGVFNVVTGGGETVGGALIANEKVDAINFTGETTTGKWILERASRTLKRVVLELGGKNPNIVFDDADLERAANAVTYGAYANNGESCAAGSRLLVHSRVKEKLVRAVVERVSRLRVGYQLEESSDVGPLVSRGQLEKVMEYVAAAESEGLKVAYGGNRLTDGIYSRGNYMQPTVVDDVPPESKLFQEEIFGPVLTVTEFSDEDEAVRLANQTVYGLAAGVWSSDLGKALRVAERVKAGAVWINTYYTLPVEMPWGGFKQSGIGRNNTVLAIEHYLEIKGIYLDSQHGPMRPYYRIVLG